MKTNLHRFALLTTVCLTALAMNALPPVYMKFDDIKGEAKPTSKEGHKDAIQIESWSFGASNPSSGNRVQGNFIGTNATACATGPLKFTVRGAEADSVKKLCQSRTPLGSITVDIDGVPHRFENASFASCQNGDGMVPTDQFTLNYARCTYHRGGVNVAAGDVNGDGAAQANARLSGLLTGPVPVHVERLTLNGTSATVSLTKVGPGTLVLSSANNAPLPQLVLELTNGTRWTFYRVVMKDILVSSATARGSSPMQQFSLNYERVEGPATGYSAR